MIMDIYGPYGPWQNYLAAGSVVDDEPDFHVFYRKSIDKVFFIEVFEATYGGWVVLGMEDYLWGIKYDSAEAAMLAADEAAKANGYILIDDEEQFHKYELLL